MRNPIKPGTILYMQGRYQCRVVADNGPSVCYEPLEGAPREQIGQRFSAGKDLFAPRRMTSAQWDGFAAGEERD